MRAFSLVELSIVLVILGLLVGGILTGQSLVRAAELRSVSTEYQKYRTALNAFKDKYFAIPGDMTAATSVWGKDNTNCAGNTGTAATPGTCNGNGDGIINVAAAASQTGEMFQFWKQLQLAGLIEGNLSGLAGPAAWNDSIIGTNVPPARLPNAGWSIDNYGNYAGSTVLPAVNYGNVLILGGQITGGASYYPNAVTPEEAWNIDTKIDDGKPASGKVILRSYNGWGAFSCSTAANQTDYTGGYNLSYTSKTCSLYFPQMF